MKNISLSLMFLLGCASVSCAQTSTFSMENLSRDVVALPSDKGGNFISWRMLGSDPKSTSFDLLRDGEAIATGLNSTTNFTDTKGTSESPVSYTHLTLPTILLV